MTGIRRDTWILFGVCVGVGSFAYLNSLESFEGFVIGPNGYVRLLSGALIALAVLALAQEVLDRKKKGMNEKKAVPTGYGGYRKIILLMIISLLFMSLLPLFGFYASGIILMVSSTITIKGALPSFRGFFNHLLFSVVTIIFIYLAFGYFMKIDLS